jgi:protoheme IX farnesyltransferase
VFKIYAQLTKIGIVIFVVLSALAGYAAGFQLENHFSWLHFLKTLLGVYLLSSGSLALNQAQEYKLDQKMPRTSNRPVASGKVTPAAAMILAIGFILGGIELLVEVAPLAAVVGGLTIALYNGVYTYYWKPRWIYAAVPGAIPGALPVTIGYVAVNPDILGPESIYLFLILFLWQMPHFWALAIKFKDDYRAGGVPTLPVALGMKRTVFQMGLYTFLYVGVALASPWLIHANWIYLALVVPTSAKILYEFFRFQKDAGDKNWLRFFIWINVSVLIYLFVPVIDKWSFLFIGSN